MRTPNWDKTFTHAVEVRVFRKNVQTQAAYKEIIARLVEEGGSFAVSAGRLWLSAYSLTIFAATVEELTEPADTASLVAQRQQERE